MSQAGIDELFAQTLAGDYEDETPWEAVHALRRLGTQEIFDKAAKWCESDNPLFRARGTDVLAQLGRTIEHPNNNFPEESYAIITELVQRETHQLPLNSAIAAMGHLGNFLAIPLIAGFHAHPDAEIRFTVAYALGSFPNDPLSVSILLKLMQDTYEDVRDWATFGLGVQGVCDSAAIRDALMERLSDSNSDVREEAMVGLAIRQDQRVLSPVLAALQDTATTKLAVEAACFLLGMENERTDWNADDYVKALRERFGV
jgi:HEAT repeat protein